MSELSSGSHIASQSVSEAGPTESLNNAPQPGSGDDEVPMDEEADGPPDSNPPNNVLSPLNNVLSCEFERLKTYPQVWPSTNYTKQDCAKNGFSWTESLMIGCFSCGLVLSPISTDEDLAEKHATSSPTCELTSHPANAANTANATNATTPKNKPIPDILNFNLEKHRLITFLRTSWEAPVDHFDLAKWGFYFTGTGDVGRCFICRLEVRGWERNDKGESEHRKWNPQCPFIQGREVGNVRIEDEVGTLEEDAMSLAANNGVIPMPGAGNLRSQDFSNMIDLTQARHSQYAQRAERLQTYSMWPMSISQRPDQLADAGFYYTGRGDRVVCFYCGGGLKDWGDGDNPWVEHAAWFSSCNFVKIMKGTPFIIQSQNLRSARSASEVRQFNQSSVNNIDAESQEPAQALATDTPRPIQHLDSERGGDEANSSSELDDSTRQLRMCKVCFEKELGIVFLPCGHMATCPDCSPQLTACPICRTKANAYVRAYLP